MKRPTPNLAALQVGGVLALAVDKPMTPSEREVAKALAWTGLVAAGASPEAAEAAIRPGAMRAALPGLAVSAARRKRRRQ